MLILRIGRLAICLACIALAFGNAAVDGGTIFYIGLFDSTGNTTLLGQYDVDLESLSTLQSPFASFDYLEYSPDGILYGIDMDTLYVIDPTTGEASSGVILNDGESAIVCSGLTFKPDGTMLVHEYSNRTGSWVHKLYSGDPATGTLTYLIDVTGVSGLYGIEYANDVLYGAYDHAFYSIDLTTGAATLIDSGSSAWDLAFGTDNVMRGTGPENGAVYIINITDGSASLVNDFNTNESKEAVGLEVVCSPTITGQPVGKMVQAGQAATFSVTANGTGALNYQWQKKNDNNVWVDIEDANENHYTLNPVAKTDAGGYRCIATNLAGEVTSGFAAINSGDANRDGAVDVGDLGILAANYGTSSGANWVMGDFNGDESVDVGDLGILAANYGWSTSGEKSSQTDSMTTNEKASNEQSDNAICTGLGLPLIAGPLIMGLMLTKLKE